MFCFIVHMISSLTLVWLFLFSLGFFSMSGDLTVTCVIKCHNFLNQPICTTVQIWFLDYFYKLKFMKSFITMNDTDISSFFCASIILKLKTKQYRSSLLNPRVDKIPRRIFGLKNNLLFIYSIFPPSLKLENLCLSIYFFFQHLE